MVGPPLVGRAARVGRPRGSDAALRERPELVGYRRVILQVLGDHQSARARLQLVLEREEALGEQAVELVAGDGPRQGGLVEDLAGRAARRRHRPASRPAKTSVAHLDLVTAILVSTSGAHRGNRRRRREAVLSPRPGPQAQPKPTAVARTTEPPIVIVFARHRVVRAPCHEGVFSEVARPRNCASQVMRAGGAGGARLARSRRREPDRCRYEHCCLVSA